MKKFIVSNCSNANFLLAEADLEAVLGAQQENVALAEAEALTLETGNPHYVWEVDLKCIKGFRQTKSVEGFSVGRSDA
jgi:hypothetical protein